jgi:uncharacterized membrane protein
MKTENTVLMQQAREALAGKWGLAVGTMFVYTLITMAIQAIPKSGGILGILVGGPMTLGLVIFSLALVRNQNPKLEQIFDGFARFSTALVAQVLVMVYVLLWALLLIIPGIIAALSYSMTFYILADNESMGAKEAMARSKKMMMGNKWKFFCLGLRFIGWALLSILTLGIGFLWLIPYLQITTTKFYEDIKGGEVTAS